MTQEKVQNIPVKNLLAVNPKDDPKYSVSLKSQKGLGLTLADPKSTRALVSLMDMQAVLGGAASHFGGPSAFAELMSATHALMFAQSKAQNKNWYDCFHFINDAGHCENGLYALKANYGFADLSLQSLKSFRSIKSQLTGHGEAHLFPEGVYISNGPLGSGLPQAQGLCAADALSGEEDRVTIAAISDGACMEGEAKESFAAIPGLAKAGKMAPFVMIISDNNTKLSGRIDEEAFSMQPTFDSLNDLGWEVVRLEKAHDLQACVDSIEAAIEKVKADPTKPIAIHAKTIKGYGVKSTEQSSSGGHGFPLKTANDMLPFLQEIYGETELPSEFVDWSKDLVSEEEQKNKNKSASSEPKEKVQVGVAKALIGKKKAGFPVVSVTSDLPGSTGVASFLKEFPGSSFDVGVAESNMVSMAAGLSKQGYIPVVDTFAQFGVTKGALPLIMANLSLAPIIAVFSHAGFQDAADGASHQALSYLAMTSAVPHTDVYCLTTSEEAELLIGEAIEKFAEARKKGETPNSQIFFLGRETFSPSIGEVKPQLGKAQVVFSDKLDSDKSVTLLAAGPLVHQALEAAKTLTAEGVGVCVVNPSVINKPDVKTLTDCLGKTGGRVVTVEDHQLTAGMGAMVAHSLSLAGVPVKMKSLGVNNTFGQSAYKANELYAKHGMDASAIVKAAKELV